MPTSSKFVYGTNLLGRGFPSAIPQLAHGLKAPRPLGGGELIAGYEHFPPAYLLAPAGPNPSTGSRTTLPGNTGNAAGGNAATST